MNISFLVKPINKYIRSDATNKLELTPVPTDFFHIKTGVVHVKSDHSVQHEYLEGVVDDAFLRDETNRKAYEAWKNPAPKAEIPLQDEAVLGDESK